VPRSVRGWQETDAQLKGTSLWTYPKGDHKPNPAGSFLPEGIVMEAEKPWTGRAKKCRGGGRHPFIAIDVRKRPEQVRQPAISG
jgi:hypothetical protein